MDDRRTPRFPVKLEVEYRTTASFLVAYSVNLSNGGMFIETEEKLEPGSRLLLRFVLPGFMPTVEGEVAWVRTRDESGPPGAGIRFLDAAAQQFGSIIDALAATFRGLRVVLFAGSEGARAQLARVLRSVLASATVVDVSRMTPDSRESRLTSADLVVVDLDGVPKEALLLISSAKDLAGGTIPVVAFAPDDLQRVRVQALGADEILASPPSLPELQAAIVRVLSKPSRVGR